MCRYRYLACRCSQLYTNTTTHISINSISQTLQPSRPAGVLECQPAKTLKVTTEKATRDDITSAVAEHEELIQSIGMMIQDLFRSHNAKVNAALDSLNQDLMKDQILSLFSY